MMVNIRFFYLFIICVVLLLFFSGCFKLKDETASVVYVNIDELMTLHPSYSEIAAAFSEKDFEDLNSSSSPLHTTSLPFGITDSFASLPEQKLSEHAENSDDDIKRARTDMLLKYHERDLKDYAHMLQSALYDSMLKEIAAGAEILRIKAEFDRESYFLSVSQQVSIAKTEVSSADYRKANKLESTQNQLTSEANAREFLAKYNETMLGFDSAVKINIEALEREVLDKYIARINQEIAREGQKEMAILPKRASEPVTLTTAKKNPLSLPAFTFSGLRGGQLNVLPINHGPTGFQENFVTKIEQNHKKDYNIIKKETYALVNLYAKRYNYIISEKRGGKDITKDVEKWIKTVWSY